ncbi:MAG TPA: VOC family protein [Terriglobales bacterium]|jgi:methylmalonyl-CoA/ethylmalonyl-CoA epimerase|nr:VOC family protein [Terriglobales bacterium]
MATPLRLHHVGFVVASIEQAMPGFLRSLAARWDVKVFHDPLQKVKVAFLTTRAEDPQIELVEPAGEDSPVLRFLEQGGGLHHVCYEVADLEQQLTEFRSRGAVIAKRPKPAVAFGGRRIAWVITAEKLLVELLEETMKDEQGP